MKRLARIIAIVGGIVAIIWAMRDRFVSVAISREPEPPAFRVHEPPRSMQGKPSRPVGRPLAAVPDPVSQQPSGGQAESSTEVTAVKGIGPVFAGRLAEAGITNVAQLAGTPPEKVADAAQVALSRATGWVEAARRMG